MLPSATSGGRLPGDVPLPAAHGPATARTDGLSTWSMMRIAFLGVQCDNANLGVAALAYSIAGMAHRLLPEPAEFLLFSENSEAELTRMKHSLGLANKTLRAVPIRHRDPRSLLAVLGELRSCAVAIDLTGGDSFADIYGLKRLAVTLFDKELVLRSGTPLVLAPQTLGPFSNRLGRVLSLRVLDRASEVFARDELSQASLSGLKREVKVATDIAVTLPWDKGSGDQDSAQPTAADTVGVNVSGLLWNGGYTGANQFGLRADYREYTRQLITALTLEGHQVQLVPHVLSRPGESPVEDDAAACRELADQFPQCTIAPAFRSPVEAKSVIATLGCFIGARMHSTIAALTSGVATVPVAYSRKFAGFFHHIGYDALVDLRELPTQSAVSATLEHVTRRQELARSADAANRRAQSLVGIFERSLAGYLDAQHPEASSAGPVVS